MAKTYPPENLQPLIRRMYLLFIPFVLLVLAWEDDVSGRLIFLGMAAVFLVLVHLMLGRYIQTHHHPLVLNAQGLHSATLAERYGTAIIPWREIAALRLVAGLPRGTRWLAIDLHPGPFRDGIAPVAGEQLAGGDINLLLAHAARPEEILQDAEDFWQRHRSSTRKA